MPTTTTGQPGSRVWRTWSLDGPNRPHALEFSAWPEANGAGRVLVASAFAGLCETDLKIWQGTATNPLIRYPIILGHEWIARVVQDPGDRWLPGQWAVVEGLTPCRQCPECNRGHSNWCRAPEHSGITYNGGFAPWSWVPVHALHPVEPRYLPAAYVFVEPASSVIRAVEMVKRRQPRTVLVLGIGSVGRLAVMLLHDRLPDAAVFTYDPVPERNRWAKEYGAVPVTAVEPDSVEAVVECSGTIEGFTQALQAAGPEAVIALEGVPERGQTAVIVPSMMHFKELTMGGIYSSTMQSFQESVEWVGRREMELAALLEGPYTASELPQLMERLRRREGLGKIYVSWPFETPS